VKLRGWTTFVVAAALASSVLFVGSAGAEDKPAKPAPKPDPVREAKLKLAELVKRLRTMLNVEPRPEDDTRVGLRYDFQQGDKPAYDFECAGLEMNLAHGVLGRGKTRAIELTAPVSKEGSFLHRLPMKGDVEVEFEFYVRSYERDDSSLTFVCDLDPKTKRWVGARWGQQLVSFDGKKVSHAGAADLANLGEQPRWVMRLSRRGDKVSLMWNGTSRGTVTVPAGTDGRVGLLARNVKVGLLSAHVIGAPVLADEN
jgi:hypothetical protein